MKTNYLLPVALILGTLSPRSLQAQTPEQTVECEILIVGGGLAGTAAAYEGLLAGKTVCMTDITDWMGGQISTQGTSALDERETQRSLSFYPRGYLELRQRIKDYYGKLNPGNCWVSESCFIPRDAYKIVRQQLEDAAEQGNGTLKWFPDTVIKKLNIKSVGEKKSQQIVSAITIQRSPALGAPPLNTTPLSQVIEDAYRYEDSPHFNKQIIRFIPQRYALNQAANWYVIEATETGEIIALADVPYRLGIDPRNYLNPSSSSVTGDPYCTQGFTYTFAMEKTAKPQFYPMPSFYPQYEPYYSYELERLANFNLVFTYRRIWNTQKGKEETFGGITFTTPTVGDISMQNWTWGNDYRPGTALDNLIYTRQQLQTKGELSSNGWQGGLRTATLYRGEENALGFFYWLIQGTTDSQLGNKVKKPHPDNRYLVGLDSPMGTIHGLSKYPYIRESRRIIGRSYPGYRNGFSIAEIDISRTDYQTQYYRQNLSPHAYRRLQATLAGVKGLDVLQGKIAADAVQRRHRATIYPDSVGIGFYAIDFHPCMVEHPPEKPGNRERQGERQAAGLAYPFEIPLRAMIPQKVDNLLVTGKNMAMSHIASAAYRVQSVEWSAGAAAGTTAVFALEREILPYELVDGILFQDRIQSLRRKLERNGNPTQFPNTSIFNQSWDSWQ
ncbi:MAG: FAD-dependent oxidoreductase [Pleurocapsa sp.]